VLKKVSGLELFFRAVVARAYPRVVAANRERSWLFFDVVLPLLATSAYVYVYRSLGAPGQFEAFALIGGAMTAYWLNMLWGMATQLYWEKEMGNLEALIMAPAPTMAIMLGMALGGLYSTTVRALAVMTAGSILFSVVLDLSGLLLVAAVFLATMAALYGMGITLSSLFFLYGREAWSGVSILQEPVYLGAGFYFPVKALGSLISLPASMIPLTLGLDAFRQLLVPGAETAGLFSVELELFLLVAQAALYVVLSAKVLDRLERAAREAGTLGLRGQ
jgi:ABC-2 type transport system permease protein